jgi:2-aminoadipate transaminase
LKQAADLGNSHFVQQIVLELIGRAGFLAGRLAAARELYRRRRDVLVDSLRESLGDRLDFATPEGGFFVWARLSNGANATALLTEALAPGVSFVPGKSFYAADADAATLRLSFSCATAEQIVAAGPRLAQSLDQVAS